MKTHLIAVAIAFLLLFNMHPCASLPIWPTGPNHPSSQQYLYSHLKESFRVEGRRVIVYRPVAIGDSSEKNFPVIVYGHGQALGADAYEKTFIHLARKGIAVIFPQYDKGFFDQDWKRMGRDYVNLAANALGRFADLAPKEVVFSGHSKGAFVALMAASTPGVILRPKSVLLFTPAGYDREQFKGMDPSIALSIVWGRGDRIIKKELVEEIFNEAPNTFAQFIEVGSYPNFEAGHFYTLHKATLFGGREGVNPFHFYGVWPWAYGAAKNEGSQYLYGELASDMGVGNSEHRVIRK